MSAKEGASEPDLCPPDEWRASVRPLRLLLLKRQEARISIIFSRRAAGRAWISALRRRLLSFRADARTPPLPILRKLPRFPPVHAGQRRRPQSVLPPAWLAGKGEEPPPRLQRHACWRGLVCQPADRPRSTSGGVATWWTGRRRSAVPFVSFGGLPDGVPAVVPAVVRPAGCCRRAPGRGW